MSASTDLVARLQRPNAPLVPLSTLVKSMGLSALPRLSRAIHAPVQKWDEVVCPSILTGAFLSIPGMIPAFILDNPAVMLAVIAAGIALSMPFFFALEKRREIARAVLRRQLEGFSAEVLTQLKDSQEFVHCRLSVALIDKLLCEKEHQDRPVAAAIVQEARGLGTNLAIGSPDAL